MGRGPARRGRPGSGSTRREPFRRRPAQAPEESTHAVGATHSTGISGPRGLGAALPVQATHSKAGRLLGPVATPTASPPTMRVRRGQASPRGRVRLGSSASGSRLQPATTCGCPRPIMGTKAVWSCVTPTSIVPCTSHQAALVAVCFPALLRRGSTRVVGCVATPYRSNHFRVPYMGVSVNVSRSLIARRGLIAGRPAPKTPPTSS